MDSASVRTPLGNTASTLAVFGALAGVVIREQPLQGMIGLRIDPSDAAAMAGAAQALGLALPGKPAWVAAGDTHVLWQAFDEWLILVPEGDQRDTVARLTSALAACHAAVTDVSDLRAAFAVSGPRAVDVLRKYCAVDFHPRAFGADGCVVTALARARVTIRRLDSAHAWQVLAERSYAPYVWALLTDGAVEFTPG